MSKSIKYVILFLLGLLTISCKKDKLAGDKEIFIGTWTWYKTEKKYSLCNPPSITLELTPLSEDKTYSIEFFEKGKVAFFENFQELSKYRIVFAGFDSTNCFDSNGNPLINYFNFTIFLDNNSGSRIQGCISADTLIVVKNFPFPDPEDACENYTSYFVKE